MMSEKNNIVAQGRGNYRRYADDSFEFTPQGKGEPMYQEQKISLFGQMPFGSFC